MKQLGYIVLFFIVMGCEKEAILTPEQQYQGVNASFIDSIKITAFELLECSMINDQDGSGPDIFIGAYFVGETDTVKTNILNNVQATDLPLQYNLGNGLVLIPPKDEESWWYPSLSIFVADYDYSSGETNYRFGSDYLDWINGGLNPNNEGVCYFKPRFYRTIVKINYEL